jgi:hypothetical protein
MSPHLLLVHLNASNLLPLQHFTIFVSAWVYTGKQDVFFGQKKNNGRACGYHMLMMKYYRNITESFNMFQRYGTAVHTVVVTLEMLVNDL